MVWETNKESTGEYPKYVIYTLDYSQNRKSPLSRKIKITNDKNQLWILFDEIIESVTYICGENEGKTLHYELDKEEVVSWWVEKEINKTWASVPPWFSKERKEWIGELTIWGNIFNGP